MTNFTVQLKKQPNKVKEDGKERNETLGPH